MESALGSYDKHDKEFAICVQQASPVEKKSETLEYSMRGSRKLNSQTKKSSFSRIHDAQDQNSSTSGKLLPFPEQTVIDFLTERCSSLTPTMEANNTQKSDRVVSKNITHNLNGASNLS